MFFGELINIFVFIDVICYFEFKQVVGSYVQQGFGFKVIVVKVFFDVGEVFKFFFMGIFEKCRMKFFIEWVGIFDFKDFVMYKGMFYIE